jgi:serine/threonine protein kinase
MEKGSNSTKPCRIPKGFKRDISEFEIMQQIGQGGYGSVKLVREKKTKQLFALKMLSKKSLNLKPENIKREVSIQARLDHPHICKLHFVIEDAT